MLYSKKIILLLTIVAAIGVISIFQSSAPVPSKTEHAAASTPIALRYWVQQLPDPVDEGNMILKIEFAPERIPGPKMEIYYADDGSVSFHDDGAAPDVEKGDYIYSAYVKEDVDVFIAGIKTMQADLEEQVGENGGFLHFTGHAGELVSEVPEFDYEGFASFQEVEVSALLLDAATCTQNILKQNSLFVTDLEVVENPARTFNVVTGQGNPIGVWTFGNLMRNMRNSSTYGDTRTFLKEWVRRWVQDHTINGQNVPARKDVFRHLIGPWLVKANHWLPDHYPFYDPNSGVTPPIESSWESDWDNTHEDSLLKYAPFRLMAIVNRMDLRQNAGFRQYGRIRYAGETRFIYTLIIPMNGLPGLGAAGDVPGGEPGSGIGGDPIDWKGMNVIFEYQNTQSSLCELRSFAHQWLDLSAYPLGSETYNAALETITRTVIQANAAPGKPNGSALAQLRTNEKIFFPSRSQPQAQAFTWRTADWELSQFELDPGSGLLLPAPVSNTPLLEANNPPAWKAIQGTIPSDVSGTPPANNASPGQIALLNWVFKNKYGVNTGRHFLPLSESYPLGGGYSDVVALAATAKMDMEQLHHWDFPWDKKTTYYDASNPQLGTFEKNMRQQLSLNTCQGCHGGETKTEFTHVRPAGYGVPQDYWSTTPATDYTNIDTRFYFNRWNSKLNAGPAENNYVMPDKEDYEHHQRISAYLTGRRFSGRAPGTWQDDNQSSFDDATDGIKDINLPGASAALFQIYDPTNNYDASATQDKSFPKPQRFEGYNELERRKKDLCNLLSTPCSSRELRGVVVPVVRGAAFNALPE